MKWRLALCCFLCAAALSAAAQKEYRVTVLHSFRVPFEESFGWGIGGGQQVGDSNNLRSGGSSHALLWSGTPESLVDLHPSGWDASFATGVAGGWQSGYLEIRGEFSRMRAVMWNGSRHSMVMLHPKGWESTTALGISLTDQVGDGAPPNSGPLARHAVRWQGTPESMVDLHPNGYVQSWAVDTDGEYQVGTAVNNNPRPALWRGTAESFVDLTPPGFSSGEVYGVANGQQAGWVNNSGNANAAIWRGTRESFVNLNPAGFGSRLFDTNGAQQVGRIARGLGTGWAAVWSGTAESMLNLHQFLPTEYKGTGEWSTANAIDAEGNIIGYARDLQQTGAARAVMWSPVPEPGTVVGLATLLALLAARRRRKIA